MRLFKLSFLKKSNSNTTKVNDVWAEQEREQYKIQEWNFNSTKQNKRDG